jgi:cytochrome c-type biogenesis protein CcmH/NrfG
LVEGAGEAVPESVPPPPMGAAEGEPGAVVERPETSVLVRQRLAENADDLDALFVLAAMEAQEGRVAEGLTILDQVLRLEPAYPGGWRFKAILHRMNGEADAERAAWHRAQAEEE